LKTNIRTWGGEDTVRKPQHTGERASKREVDVEGCENVSSGKGRGRGGRGGAGAVEGACGEAREITGGFWGEIGVVVYLGG